MKKMTIAMIGVSWMLLFPACSEHTTMSEPTSELDSTGTWRLTSMTIAGETTARPDAAEGTLSFANGQVSGIGSCNSFSGGCKVGVGKLEFGEYLMTAMGCDHLEFESQFLGALFASTKYVLEGETLTLFDETTKNQLTFVPKAISHLPLEGTMWSCIGLQEEDADSVAMTMAQGEFTIRFERGGKASGSIACNSFSASADISSAGAIKIALSGVTEMACDGPHDAFEAEFIQGLNNADHYKIAGNQLQLIQSKTGKRLVFEGAAAAD